MTSVTVFQTYCSWFGSWGSWGLSLLLFDEGGENPRPLASPWQECLEMWILLLKCSMCRSSPLSYSITLRIVIDHMTFLLLLSYFLKFLILFAKLEHLRWNMYFTFRRGMIWCNIDYIVLFFKVILLGAQLDYQQSALMILVHNNEMKVHQRKMKIRPNREP